MGRIEAGQPLWKRLAYVAITRPRSGSSGWCAMLSKPRSRSHVDDLFVPPEALQLEEERHEDHHRDRASAGIGRAVAEHFCWKRAGGGA
jgi:hypothetical protein